MASQELQAALEAARAAGELIQALYRRNLAVTLKADKSPVTEADVRAEELIRGVLCARFPQYGFCGEETGRERMQSESIWLVDPIDGTKSFVRDCPFFSTQIALMRGGRLVLGVSSAASYGELAWAEEGHGAFLDGKRVQVSTHRTSSMRRSFRAAISRRWRPRASAGRRFGALVGRVNRLRGYGDFLHYHLLARGALEAVIESDVNILDIAALTVIVREAGGIVTDIDGAPVGMATTSVLAANPALHAAVLAAMRGV